MNYVFNRLISNEFLSKKMFEEYIPSSLSLAENHNRKDLILILTVLCGFIGKEEIVTITGMSYRYCEKIISTLLNAKLIDPIPLKFGFRTSRTTTLYTYTKKGFDTAVKSDTGLVVKNAYHKLKIYPTNRNDYLAGMNLLECLNGLKGKKISWIRYSEYNSRIKNQSSPIVSCEISISGFTLHIKEFTDNESTATIMNNLLLYQEYPSIIDPILPSDKRAILISIYIPFYFESEMFFQKNVNLLAELVKNSDPHMLLVNAIGKEELSSSVNKTLNSLYKEGPKGNDGKSILKVSDLLEMSGKYATDNPFYQNAFKKEQYKLFREKKDTFFKILNVSGDYKSIRRTVYKGSPIYIAPTILLERYILFICDFQSYADKLNACLSAYFGKLSFQNYLPVSTIVDGLTLRNQIPAKYGTVFVEFPTIDMGAKLRINRFMNYRSKINSVNHLIIIVDYTSEAEEITKWIQDFNRADEQPKVSGDNKTPKHLFTIKGINDIYYLLRSDLENGTPERLFYITGYKEYKNDKGVLVSSGKCMLFNLISENNPCLKRNN